MIEQGSQEWRELRLGKVTGSGVTNVIAKGKGGEEAVTRRNYRIKLAVERMTGRLSDEDDFENHAMRRGKEQESFARMAYEIKNGILVDLVPFVDHPTIPWCGYSPDGLVGEDGLIETKCPTLGVHYGYIEAAGALRSAGKPLLSVLPAAYRRQCLLGLSCCPGREWIDWNSFNSLATPETELFTIRIRRDEEIIAEVEREIRLFNEDVDKTIEMIKKHGITSTGEPYFE